MPSRSIQNGENPCWRHSCPNAYKLLPERTDRLEEALIRLSGQSAETDRRLHELAEETNKRFQEMAARLDELTGRVNDLTVRLDRLVERVDAMQKDLADLKGFHLEQYYRTNATAILGLFFRRLRVMDKGALLDSLYDQQPLTRQEWEQISAIDLLVTDEEQVLVWEISWTVDESDVLRALERAEILRQRGMNTQPVVAGKGITGNALHLAKGRKVLAVLEAFPVDGTGIVG